MVTQPSSRTFVYGRFFWPGSQAHLKHPPAPPFIYRRPDEAAVEILREFSARELVGKVYVKGPSGNWIPVDWNQLNQYEWFKFYQRFPKHPALPLFGFAVEGSGNWQVLYLRKESDATGPYVAIALQAT